MKFVKISKLKSLSCISISVDSMLLFVLISGLFLRSCCVGACRQVIQHVQSGDSPLPPRCCPPEVSRVMTGCWRRQPDERLRMTEVRRALDATLRRLVTSSPRGGHVAGNSCDNEYLELLDTEPMS